MQIFLYSVVVDSNCPHSIHCDSVYTVWACELQTDRDVVQLLVNLPRPQAQTVGSLQPHVDSPEVRLLTPCP